MGIGADRSACELPVAARAAISASTWMCWQGDLGGRDRPIQIDCDLASAMQRSEKPVASRDQMRFIFWMAVIQMCTACAHAPTRDDSPNCFAPLKEWSCKSEHSDGMTFDVTVAADGRVMRAQAILSNPNPIQVSVAKCVAAHPDQLPRERIPKTPGVYKFTRFTHDGCDDFSTPVEH